jgi:hypothetical protein
MEAIPLGKNLISCLRSIFNKKDKSNSTKNHKSSATKDSSISTQQMERIFRQSNIPTPIYMDTVPSLEVRKEQTPFTPTKENLPIDFWMFYK